MKNNTPLLNCIGNYILLGNNIEDLKVNAKKIATKVRNQCPASFNASEAFIEYDIRYTPPFEKHFETLFNLQGIAAEKPRFQDEYRGYIILDVSKYLQHEKEEWFDITMKFLHDQNEIWKYIFLVDMKNTRAGEEMVSKILSLLFCKVEDMRESLDAEAKRFILQECKANNVSLSKVALSFTESYLLKKEGAREAVSTLLLELANKYGSRKTIDMKMLNEQIKSGSSVIRYMLNTDKYALFLALLEEFVMKGLEHGEKV